MCDCHRRTILGGAAGLAMTAFAGIALAQTPQAPGGAEKPPEGAARRIYTCPPCGCPMDGKDLPGPGDCPGCSMPLVEKVAAKPEPAKPAEPAPSPGQAAPKPS